MALSSVRDPRPVIVGIAARIRRDRGLAAELDEEAPAGSGDDVFGAEHVFVYANNGG